MLTEDELRQMARDERRNRIIAELCRMLDIERIDVELDYCDEIAVSGAWILEVQISFPNGLYGIYYPLIQEGSQIVPKGITLAGGKCLDLAVEHIKLAKRVKQLEMENAFFRACGLTN